MANLRDLRRRIKSVSNTKQLTRAMKMVSAAKLRRAEASLRAARPYAEQMKRVLASVASRAATTDHPLLATPEGNRVELLVVTADRGLCGGFNANIVKAANRFLAEHQDDVLSIHCVGKKGRDFFRRGTNPIRREHADIFRQVEFGQASEIAQELIERFLAHDLDAVYVIYNEFKSAVSSCVVTERLLPLERMEVEEDGPRLEYLYEPGVAQLLDFLLPRDVETQMYRILLESSAAEHGARMAAMESATTNAGDMIRDLTLTLNRVRQASITREIIEVVSGAGLSA
jgi:F-type H+-transporting ATPase subunit gamma